MYSQSLFDHDFYISEVLKSDKIGELFIINFPATSPASLRGKAVTFTLDLNSSLLLSLLPSHQARAGASVEFLSPTQVTATTGGLAERPSGFRSVFSAN